MSRTGLFVFEEKNHFGGNVTDGSKYSFILDIHYQCNHHTNYSSALEQVLFSLFI